MQKRTGTVVEEVSSVASTKSATVAVTAAALPVLKVYVIHTPALTIRGKKLENVIQLLKITAQKCGYKPEVALIIAPDPAALQNQLETLQTKVSYDPTENPEFDKFTQILSLEMISNIEKHKEALKKIANARSTNAGDLYMVIEDDVVILRDCIENLEDLLKMNHADLDWDFISMGISKTVDKTEKQALETINMLDSNSRVLPSKEAYLIRKSVATKLLPDFETYKFTYRVQLSWLLSKGANAGAGVSAFKVMFPRKRTTIDGSKLGLFPSSIHSNNILTFNTEYMQLYAFLSKTKEEIVANMPAIDNLYKTTKGLHSCDFSHIYGLIKIKADDLVTGELLLMEAVEQVKQSQGLLNSRSDLANNLVEIYQHIQRDIPEIFSKPSKYSSACASASAKATPA